jgi:hypothetical protein
MRVSINTNLWACGSPAWTTGSCDASMNPCLPRSPALTELPDRLRNALVGDDVLARVEPLDEAPT